MIKHRSRAVAVAIVTAAALAACSAKAPPTFAGASASPSGTSISPSPSTSAAPIPLEPLTGLPGTETGSAVVVPVNVAAGSPAPVGFGDADIVSIEFSEQGALHLVGIFQSKYPTKVGPVAEVRPSDLKLVSTTSPVIAQTGTPSGFLDTAKTFQLTVRTGSKTASGFTSSGSSLYANPNTLRTGGKGTPTGMFEYADIGRALSRLNVDTASKVVVSVPGHATITWTYDSAANVWHTKIGGVVMTTTNIVIITTPYITKHISALRKDLTYADPLDGGKATVVAGDSTISAIWSKKSFNSALNLLGPDQDTPQLTAGPTWIMMIPATAKVTTS